MVYAFFIIPLRAASSGRAAGAKGGGGAAPFAPPASSVSVLSPYFDQQQAEMEAEAAQAAAAWDGTGGERKETLAAEGRVWVGRFYTVEGNDRSAVPRREAVAARVREEFELQGGMAYADADAAGGAGQQAGGGGGPGGKAKRKGAQRTGVFPVPAGKLFATPKVVVWQQFMDCAYVAVCDAATANVPLAANFLCVFVSAVVEHFGNYGIFTSPAQFYSRPEDVFVLLDKFLPNGQLSYIRGNLVKTLLDEAQAMLQMRSLIKKAKIAIA